MIFNALVLALQHHDREIKTFTSLLTCSIKPLTLYFVSDLIFSKYFSARKLDFTLWFWNYFSQLCTNWKVFIWQVSFLYIRESWILYPQSCLYIAVTQLILLFSYTKSKSSCMLQSCSTFLNYVVLLNLIPTKSLIVHLLSTGSLNLGLSESWILASKSLSLLKLQRWSYHFSLIPYQEVVPLQNKSAPPWRREYYVQSLISS